MKECNCVELTNKQLAERGVRLKSAMMFNMATLTSRVLSPLLAVEWIDKPKRGKCLPTISGAFCPVWGKKRGSDSSDKPAKPKPKKGRKP